MAEFRERLEDDETIVGPRSDTPTGEVIARICRDLELNPRLEPLGRSRRPGRSRRRGAGVEGRPVRLLLCEAGESLPRT